MKRYLLFLSLFISSFAFGQADSIPSHSNRSLAAYFVDSIRISSTAIAYIKPDDIKEVYVSKNFIDKAVNIKGAIYITTKNPTTYNFIGLEEITKVCGVTVTGAVIYMVDNQFIKDTQYFKLPSSVIHGVIILKGNEFDTLKSDLPNLSIVKIITKDNAPKSTGLMIRGTTEK